MTSEQLHVVDALKRSLGEQYVITDPEERRYFSHDLSWEPSEVAAMVVQPGSVEELSMELATANAAGIAIVPRGGGISYTRGYIPALTATMLIDMRRLNQIIEVNIEDMYVTAECGCMWEQLYVTLRTQGVNSVRLMFCSEVQANAPVPHGRVLLPYSPSR